MRILLFKNLMKNGTHENLFDNCPPFQIDGNFGGTAGIAELLLQSHAGYVSILPALPDEMSSGSVKGLVAEGNFVVDIDWANMEPTNVSVTSRSGNRLSLKCGAVAQVVDVTSGNIVTEISQDSNGAISFDTEAGHTYQVVPGEEASLMAAQNLVDEIESKGIVSYMYSSETGAEFEEAFMACKRMVEQGNYMISDVDKVMQRLVDAENALQRREGEEYSAAAALRFLENAASVNYEGSETEDQWRQQIEYERTDLIEALENGTMSGSELLSAARTLAETGNEIAGYSSMRNNLFDLIQKAASLQQESRTDEEWAEYQKAVDQAVQIYANPNAEEKDLQAAYDRLKATVDTMTTTFTIHASSEGTGSISPDGTVTVLGGASQEFLIEPEENAEILDVLVDGMSVGAVSSYVFQNVSADGTIKADFVRTEEEKTEAEILLDQAIERAESLNEEDYSSATWLNLQNALADAKSTDRTDPQDMQEKAETLLNAMDSLIIWGEAERTEAEVSGLYPVADYSNSSVYNDPSNWGG